MDSEKHLAVARPAEMAALPREVTRLLCSQDKLCRVSLGAFVIYEQRFDQHIYEHVINDLPQPNRLPFLDRDVCGTEGIPVGMNFNRALRVLSNSAGAAEEANCGQRQYFGVGNHPESFPPIHL
jgi:hypothetical protein